jgi:L-serine dehydratase
MRSEEVIHSELMRIWNTMLECMYIGCHTRDPTWGHVRRRAFDMHQNLIGLSNYSSPQTWLEEIRTTEVKFRQILNGC